MPNTGAVQPEPSEPLHTEPELQPVPERESSDSHESQSPRTPPGHTSLTAEAEDAKKAVAKTTVTVYPVRTFTLDFASLANLYTELENKGEMGVSLKAKWRRKRTEGSSRFESLDEFMEYEVEDARIVDLLIERDWSPVNVSVRFRGGWFVRRPVCVSVTSDHEKTPLGGEIFGHMVKTQLRPSWYSPVSVLGLAPRGSFRLWKNHKPSLSVRLKAQLTTTRIGTAASLIALLITVYLLIFR